MQPIADRGTVRTFLCSLFCVAALGGNAFAAGDLSAAEIRGKNIYTKGESTSSRIITASIAKSEAPTTASILPCTQCHGVDGRGIGIISPDINWEVLVDPAGHEHLLRTHGPYDDASVAKAIIEGVDPAGNVLEATMPRYSMTDADMADLIAYLKRIDVELDPGINVDSIRIGTVLPTAGALGGAGNAMWKMINAYFDFVNANGGVHGRDLELVVGEYGGDDAPAFWAVQDTVRQEALFALIAAYVPGFEAELSQLVEEQKLPMIGPYTWLGVSGSGRYEFSVTAGLAEQAEALVEALLSQASTAHTDAAPRIAVVYPYAKGFDVLAAVVSQRVARHSEDRVTSKPYALGQFDAAAIAKELQTASIDAVVFLGSAGEFVQFGKQAAKVDWQPTLLSPALLAERGVFDLPNNFGGEVFLAYASLPHDHTPEGKDLFEALHRDAGISYEFSVAQIAAFSAARVLVEALQRTGPTPSRERLVSALESLQDFDPGLSAGVSFASDRRMGPGGAWVVRVDLIEGRLDAAQRWIELD